VPKRSASGFIERLFPGDAVSYDMQKPLRGWHVVVVAGSDDLPGVARRVGLSNAEGGQQPGFAIGAMVIERLA
jgi:hypothetical protein